MAKLELTLCLMALLSPAFSAMMMPGGWHKADVEDKAIQALALAATQEIDMRSNSMFRSKLLKVTKAETQVVAGTNYRITIDIGTTDCKKSSDDDLESCTIVEKEECTIQFFLQPWMKTQEVTDLKCSQKQLLDAPIKPETEPLLGGEDEANPETEEVKAAAAYAVEEINRRSNSFYRTVLLDISHVTRQTVAGTRFKMMLKMGKTKCKNSKSFEGKTVEDCPVTGAQASECSVVVLDQPWMQNRYQLVDFTCNRLSANSKQDNNDAVMNQFPDQRKLILGGDDHDIGNYGTFLEFKKKHNKVYKDKAEEKSRYLIFRDNMKKARKMQDKERGDATYGASPFADLTEEEFRKNYLSPVWDLSYDSFLKPADIPTETPPDEFDWRDHNAVTPVKNQGMCGSCWAFSTTGNVEGQWAIKKKQLLSLSEQELVDCDKLDEGCNGGLPTNAYKEIMRIGGLETEKDYPYEGKDDKCEFVKQEAEVFISGAVNISSNEDDMKAWLWKNGPISIGINANMMQFYMGGVSHPWSIFCNPDSLDHGVLITGYGIKKGIFHNTPYWAIKNSWGESWGEKGYYLVYRGGGVCGVNKMPTSATVN